jgi:hypothetical protein
VQHAHATDRTTRSLRRLVAVGVAILVLLPTTAAASDPIEDYAPYQPQTHCSPKAKPGTLELAAWLLKAYPGSASDGISRPCSSGGVSEHKEGRAFDWALSFKSDRDRGYAKDFLSRLFATDADGNTDALARRMGVMYVIWDDHIYASYYQFSKRDYLDSSCKSTKKCSDNLRHRTHMHISLDRPGGWGETSWYDGQGGSTTPTYKATAVPADGTRTTTKAVLQKGKAYKITAAGLFSYGTTRQIGDAACVWSTTRHTWVPRPTAAVRRSHGALDLSVNGGRVFGSKCHASHIYSARFTPKRAQHLRLRMANKGRNASGHLAVVVSPRSADVSKSLPAYPTLSAAPAPPTTNETGDRLFTETVTLPASKPEVETSGALEAGATYQITMSGTVGLGKQVLSDGQCVAVRGKWYRNASVDMRVPDANHATLYLDGMPFEGTGRCATHQHVTTYTAATSGRLSLALWDPLSHKNNTGSLSVELQQVGA